MFEKRLRVLALMKRHTFSSNSFCCITLFEMLIYSTLAPSDKVLDSSAIEKEVALNPTEENNDKSNTSKNC